MQIPDQYDEIVKRLVRGDYVEKHATALLLERTHSPDHPDVQRARRELEPVADLFRQVDPLEAERLLVAA